MFGKAFDPCQDLPASFFENLNDSGRNGKVGKKKSLLKRLWSVEGLFMLSIIGTLMTVVLIDSDDSLPRNRRSHQSKSNYNNINHRNTPPNFNFNRNPLFASVPQSKQTRHS